MKYYLISISILLIFLIIYSLFIHKKEKIENYKIAIYTCFFGGNDNSSYVINDPNTKYDCYYFTNNKSMLEKLKNTKWIPIFIDIPVKNDMILDAFDSKKLKACPHIYDIINNYDITIYMDSKLKLKNNINHLIYKFINSDKLYVIPKHNFVFDVYEEFYESIKQERYFKEKDKYEKYINKYLSKGFSKKVKNHYTTSFIMRKNNDKVKIINNMWYEHIKECGIECQISFFFIQQIFKDFILPIEWEEYYTY